MGAGSCRVEITGPNRHRAGERFRKFDLVMLAITINMNDGAFAAFRQ